MGISAGVGYVVLSYCEDFICRTGRRSCVLVLVMESAAGDGDRLPLKMCLISLRGIGARHGMAAATLQDLQRKVLDLLPSPQTVTLVLEEDGTIVDDEDYFLCLPTNTKFVALGTNQTWTPRAVDEPDASSPPRWKQLAAQMKEDLSRVILLSEDDLQLLTDIPCHELAEEMAESPNKVRVLQDTLQRLLDRREDERQSKQLLQLYLEALKGEGTAEPMETVSTSEHSRDEVDLSGDSVNSNSIRLNHHILRILKEKSSPEISLSNLQLEAVFREDLDTLALELSWDKSKVSALQQACEQEILRRLQQLQSLRSLNIVSTGRKVLPKRRPPLAKRRK
ncbi:DNA fragmentation factor subunit alpha isoform X2 [Ambystoma mexicanum]|uniref:DNA fragmentation factor subunit alpha isoform X2 n=1 Tax=Ambystoma mexicanum TaxID=8296 RepID=UPI0037E750C7